MEVLSKCCNECLFSKNKIVSDGRKKELLENIEAADSYFICHKASAVNRDVVCRGFYEKKTCNKIRISQRMGWIETVSEAELIQGT